MATSFPGAVDTTNLTNPATTDKTNSPSHAGLHANSNDAVKAVETKLGTGSSTPATSTLLFGTGAGTSAWQTLTSAQLAAVLSDETGTGSAVFATTPTLVTPKVDTINEATLSNGVTVAGLNIKSGAITTAASVPSTAFSTAGTPIQIVSTNYSAVATGTTLIPLDDTIPQITEGDQYMTQAITPKSTTNILVISAVFYGAFSVGLNDLTVALFQDSTANALAAISDTPAGNSYRIILPLVYTVAAGTISSTTFRIRAGGAGAGTTTFNGSGGARNFGAISKSSITIMEYKA